MITTHVLDTASGKPAAGVAIELELRGPDGRWHKLGAGQTDADGRLRTLAPAEAPLEAGTYRLRFHTDGYFAARNTQGFYPYVEVVFTLLEAGAHCHVPLLLSPYGYSTYRGS
jgi:5-hydroxyisourate hydrolase